MLAPSSVAGAIGMEFDAAKSALKVQAKYFSENAITKTSSWTSKAESLTAAKYASWGTKALGGASMILTGVEAFRNGNFSVGDGVRVGLSAFTTFGGPLGLFYGAVDFGFAIFSGTSLTDRIGNMVDEEIAKHR